MAAPLNYGNIKISLDALERQINSRQLGDAPFAEINRIKRAFNSIAVGSNAAQFNELGSRINALEDRIRKLNSEQAPIVQFAKQANIAAARPNGSQNRIVEIRAKLRRDMPELAALVSGYEQGRAIKLKDYESEYVKVMKKLGYQDQEIYSESRMGRIMNPQETLDVFNRIRDRLGIQDLIFLPFDETPPESRTFGHFLTGEGHNQFAIHQKGLSYICPEYPEDASQTRNPPIRKLTPSEVPRECEQPIELRVLRTIPERQALFQGKITNINSCALESCIMCLAYLLA